MPNNRIFYPIQAVGIGKSPTPTGSIVSESSGFRWMKGVQTAGMSVTFNNEEVMQLGQLEVYQDIEDTPDVEVNIEKVIDGHHLLYLQAVGNAGTGNIIQALDKKSDVYFVIYPDTNTASSGNTIESLIYCSGMYAASYGLNFSVDGNATETLGLIGSNKQEYTIDQLTDMSLNTGFAPMGHTPHSPNVNVGRRQHVQTAASTIPASVQKAIRGGSGNIQSISMSVDFGRENLYELGRFGPYYRSSTAPISVTCDFEVISISGDRVNVSETTTNLVPESIKIFVDTNGANGGEGQMTVDLGTRNKLTSVQYGGGDAGGGNSSVTYSYRNLNYMLINDSNAVAGGASGYWI